MAMIIDSSSNRLIDVNGNELYDSNGDDESLPTEPNIPLSIGISIGI